MVTECCPGDLDIDDDFYLTDNERTLIFITNLIEQK